MDKLGNIVRNLFPEDVEMGYSFRLTQTIPELPEGKIGSVYEWNGKYFEGPGEMVVFFHAFQKLKSKNKVEVLGNERNCVRDVMGNGLDTVLDKVA